MTKYRYRLDLQLFSQEKTEKATPKKRGDARQKGQVAKSAELPGAFTLLLVFASFLFLGDMYKERVTRLFRDLFESWLTMDLTAGNVQVLFRTLMLDTILMVAPVFAIAIIVGIIGNYVQVGVLFTGQPIVPKFSKLNPISGFKQLLSMRSLVEFVKNVLKLLIIGFLVYTSIIGEKDTILSLAGAELQDSFNFAVTLTISLGIKIGAVLIVLAVFDYLYQKYEYEKSLRMSKQDIKDEHKNAEGDPLIKGKIKERQRRMALQRMMQEVPKADVIITNPTHYAVALQYDAKRMEAPVVLAKGVDHVALRIREVAKEHDITTMENRPLARALYDRTEIGDSIPADLFQAVAEVLAYIYKLKGRTGSAKR